VEVVATVRVEPVDHSVASLVLTADANTLVVTDGYILDEEKPDIYFYSADSLAPLGTMAIKSSLPWSFRSLILSGQRLLVCNRQIDIDSRKAKLWLDERAIVERGNATPLPLAISADGRSAIVHVNSYLGNQLDVLGQFDLDSGTLIHRFAEGKRFADVNARYIDGSTLLFRYRDGELEVHDVFTRKVRTLESRAPAGSHRLAKNLDLIPLVNRNQIALAGHSKVVVIDIQKDEVRFSDQSAGANAIVPADGKLAYQVWKLEDDGTRPRARPYLRVLETQSWRTISELPLPERYDILLWSPTGEQLFAVRRDIISLLRVDWGMDLESDQPSRSLKQNCKTAKSSTHHGNPWRATPACCIQGPGSFRCRVRSWSNRPCQP
jgi:hypothetical protein